MNNEPALPPLRVSVKRASEALSISLAYAYRLIDNGKLNAVVDGGRRYVLTSELMRYVHGLEPVQPTHADPIKAKPRGRRPRAAVTI